MAPTLPAGEARLPVPLLVGASQRPLRPACGPGEWRGPAPSFQVRHRLCRRGSRCRSVGDGGRAGSGRRPAGGTRPSCPPSASMDGRRGTGVGTGRPCRCREPALGVGWDCHAVPGRAGRPGSSGLKEEG